MKKTLHQLLCYCNGKFCALKNKCRRHRESTTASGLSAPDASVIDNCDPESRNLFLDCEKCSDER
jgi:hypothetical protein